MEIRKNGEPLANSYYHWEVYTTSAIELTLEVIRFLETHCPNIKDLFLAAIRALEQIGAGITE